MQATLFGIIDHAPNNDALSHLRNQHHIDLSGYVADTGHPLHAAAIAVMETTVRLLALAGERKRQEHTQDVALKHGRHDTVAATAAQLNRLDGKAEGLTDAITLHMAAFAALPATLAAQV